jgi:regulator of sirC expression with transglutaminase-like and TPR domain
VDATDAFAEIVSRPSFPLDEAALAIAAHAYPDIAIAAELARLDEVAGWVKQPTCSELRRVLYGDLALRGNAEDYYNPDNSFLNRVLDTGLGIPISLAVVMLEVGRRAGVHLVGINAPSHFLVRDETDRVLLDPFNSAVEMPPIDAPVAGPLTIVDRMLNNLRSIYANRGQLDNLLWVLRLRTLLPDAAPETGYELQRALAKLN